MSERIEGTFFLDGLVQGKLPPSPDALVSLREWVDAASSAGVRFHLEMEGPSFNLLADNKPATVATLGPAGTEAIAEKLQDLLNLHPPGVAIAMVSTVRSTEYRPGLQVQVAYAFGPDGQVHTREVLTPVSTQPPEPPLTGRQRVRYVLVGLAIAAAALAISALWVDYGQILGNIRDRITPVDVEQIEIDLGRYAGYFEIVARRQETSQDKSSWLVLTLKRTDKFPITDSDADNLFTAAATVQERLAAQALARGYIPCELFGDGEDPLGQFQLRVAALRRHDQREVRLPLGHRSRLLRVQFVY